VTDAQVERFVNDACASIAAAVEAGDSRKAADFAVFVEHVAIPPEVRAERIRARRAEGRRCAARSCGERVLLGEGHCREHYSW
jgi:hypothetical protein